MTGYRKESQGPTLCNPASLSGCSRSRNWSRVLKALLAVAICSAGSLSSLAQATTPNVLRVSASADLTLVMPVLAQTYERATGVKMIVTLGPSARQVAQIEAGSPTDLFLGADFTFPEKLVADGLTDAKAPVAYANGTLVLYALKSSPLQPLNLERLEDPRLQSLAIADQLHSPFGRASASALSKLKLMDKLLPKLVVKEDVMRAAEEVESGKAQMGLISLTIAKSQRYSRVGSYVLVPESQYPPVKQYAAVLRTGNVAAAHRFLEWITSSDIQSKLGNIGLDAVR